MERKLNLSLGVCGYVFGGWVEGGGDGLVIRKDTTDSRVM